jgi:hypothetical protein
MGGGRGFQFRAGLPGGRDKFLRPMISRVRASRLAGDAHLARRISRVLADDGIVRIDGLLPPPLVSSLERRAVDALALAQADVYRGKFLADEVFAEHLLPPNNAQCGRRFDVKLPLERTVREALRSSVHALRHVYGRLLGPRAQLFECSALVSGRGTPAQQLHPDFPPEDLHLSSYDMRYRPVALVAFVALADVHHGLGPTRFVPCTHSRAFHVTHALDGGAALAAASARRSCTPLLSRGDAVLMDSALFHAGGANSLGRRALFHFTFKRPGAYVGGRLSSLLTELRDRHSLADLSWLDASATDGGASKRRPPAPPRCMRPWVPPAFWERRLPRTVAARLRRPRVSGAL